MSPMSGLAWIILNALGLFDAPIWILQDISGILAPFETLLLYFSAVILHFLTVAHHDFSIIFNSLPFTHCLVKLLTNNAIPSLAACSAFHNRFTQPKVMEVIVLPYIMSSIQNFGEEVNCMLFETLKNLGQNL